MPASQAEGCLTLQMYAASLRGPFALFIRMADQLHMAHWMTSRLFTHNRVLSSTYMGAMSDTRTMYEGYLTTKEQCRRKIRLIIL